MFRIALAIATVATIFTLSPHRQGLGLADSVAAASKAAPTQLIGALAGTSVGPALAGAVLRRTLAEPGDLAGQVAAAGDTRPEPANRDR